MGNKVVSVNVRVPKPDLTLKYLRDESLVRSSIPYLVGVVGGKVVLRFTRALLFHFKDAYDVLVKSSNDGVNYLFAGERSNIELAFKASADSIVGTAAYDGPRAWVVRPCLGKVLNALINEARARAGEAVEAAREGTADYSEKLALVSWVSKLLMRSILIKSEIVAMPKGGLVSYVEKLADEVLRKYRVVYVSGASDSGTFRLLFINGALAGTYINLGGKEYVGDEKALNLFEGFTQIRVYGSMLDNLDAL